MAINFLFGLPEGHWLNEKTANVVISMLHADIEDARQASRPTALFRAIDLNADICSGQNKKRSIVWYLVWRVLVGLDNSISLYFLVGGHTKNVCDGAFGHVKRKVR